MMFPALAICQSNKQIESEKGATTSLPQLRGKLVSNFTKEIWQENNPTK